MAISDVGIVNLALIRVGSDVISDFDELNDRSRVAKRSYEQARDTTLQSFPWNFADKRQTISEDAESPAFGFVSQYSLPNSPKSMKVIQIGERGTRFKVEGQKILTDETSPINVIYTSLVTDPNFFTPTFTNALVLLLASDFATTFKQNQSLSESLQKQFLLSIKNAKRVDSQEGTAETFSRDRSLFGRRRSTSGIHE